jgi:large subunit ribosomal protein L15
MTVRKRRKKNKLRGQRTHGHGDTKNRRGAGSRGGRGRAGSHKHKFTKYYGGFGKEKKKLRGKARGRALNLDQIGQFLGEWVAAGKAEKKGNTFAVDGKKAGFAKIVARGELQARIAFENVKASKRALEKLKKSGSTVKEHGKEAESHGSS